MTSKRSPPVLASFCGSPVRSPSVRSAQKPYSRMLEIPKTAAVRRLGPVQEEVGFGSVRILAVVPLQHAERHQRVEEIAGAARMDAQALHKRFGVQRAVGQFSKQAQLDGAEQGLQPQ